MIKQSQNPIFISIILGYNKNLTQLLLMYMKYKPINKRSCIKQQ